MEGGWVCGCYSRGQGSVGARGRAIWGMLHRPGGWYGCVGGRGGGRGV